MNGVAHPVGVIAPGRATDARPHEEQPGDLVRRLLLHPVPRTREDVLPDQSGERARLVLDRGSQPGAGVPTVG